MDLDRLERLLYLGAAVSFAILIVAQVGEHPRWWNDIGELGTLFGTVAGVLLAALAFLLSATKDQVRAVGTGIGAANAKLDGALGQLGAANAKLDAALGQLGGVNAKLDLSLAQHTETNRKLDLSLAQHAETNQRLEAMTGILVQIRDRL